MIRHQDPETQAAALPDMADGLREQLYTLSQAPTPWACELMAVNLQGAQRAVMRLREALLQEQQNPIA